MRYAAAIFDLDGTLADTLATIAAALNHGLGAIGRPTLSHPEVARIVGEGVAQLCAKALKGETPELVDRLLTETRAFYARNPMLHCRLYPGMQEMLDGLRDSKTRLAVLSNKPHDLTLATIAGLGLEERFEIVLGHREDFPRKPDPTSARHIVEQLGLARERVLYVGDTPIDMQTAKAAQLDVVAVTWGFRSRQELEPFAPNFVVTTPQEIVTICRGVPC